MYSNNDNKLSIISSRFHLLSSLKLGPNRSHLAAPVLSNIEPVSETSIAIHWTMPTHLPFPVEGFFVYYRPSTSAGEYSKETVMGHSLRHFKIDHLESGQSYEFKLQSFTALAASNFSAILTGRTLSKFKYIFTNFSITNSKNHFRTTNNDNHSLSCCCIRCISKTKLVPSNDCWSSSRMYTAFPHFHYDLHSS